MYKLLENVSNINFSKAKFTNSSNIVNSNNFTVNHTQSEFSQSALGNQTKIIGLIEIQNKLIEKL